MGDSRSSCSDTDRHKLEQIAGRDNDEIDRIDELKRHKIRTKTAFTKLRHSALRVLDSEAPSRREIREHQAKLDLAQDDALEIMLALSEEYKRDGDKLNYQKVLTEMERLEQELAETQDRCQNYLDSKKGETSSVATEEKLAETQRWVERSVGHVPSLPSNMPPLLPPVHPATNRAEHGEKIDRIRENRSDHSHSPFIPKPEPKGTARALGNDMWKQLKRISIPIFSGEKSMYEGWKAAFLACVDCAPATPEYKLLQLRECLSGEALKCVESLGHSATAYEAAKERLERKFGGKRRQLALYLERIERFEPIRPGKSKDVEKFADLLDVAFVNLKEAGREGELGNGSLYTQLLKKMTEPMVVQFQRWLREHMKVENVTTLREWVNIESELQTIACEAVHGIENSKEKKEVRSKKSVDSRTFYSESRDQSKKQVSSGRACSACQGQHGIWTCAKFKSMSISQRWDLAKNKKLCFRCLGDTHSGIHCRRTQVCGINRCVKNHHRLLHRDPTIVSTGGNEASSSNVEQSERVVVNRNSESERVACSESDIGETHSRTEGDNRLERTHTTTSSNTGCLALRTIPVVLSHGNRRIKVNALLDDASTKTYITSDVAHELGLHGPIRRVTVNVLNGHEESIETKDVSLKLESLDGITCETISALTINEITGDMETIDWNQFSGKWDHLRNIEFPKIGKKSRVDILIGSDYAELQYSKQEVLGNPGEPVARLTPLGWTCIGKPVEGSHLQTTFVRTFFVKETSNLEQLVQSFWDSEESGLLPQNSQTPEENKILEQLENSVSYDGESYTVPIPWKNECPKMPDNSEMALKRLENTEKRLLKDPVVGKAYCDVIDQYLEKGYISKIDCPDGEVNLQWYLPHFPVIRNDKDTTKVRVVFDASAKQAEISLNEFIHQGPKLQCDLFDVLLRFRKENVALVCDIAEMYMQIKLNSCDKPYHRFLWRNLETGKTPDVYEFNRVVFGVNCSPFLAQFVSQKNANDHSDQFPRASETVLKSTYMDDSMDSVASTEEAIKLYQDLSSLWGKAGMYARKWLSNSQKVLEHIPIEDRACQVDIQSQELPSIKTLGIVWVADRDVFTFKSEMFDSDDYKEFTKRKFLRKIATLFDPLGFLVPFTIRAKILLQEMWVSGVDWDENIGEKLSASVDVWFKELTEIENIKIPRCLKLDQPKIEETLHVFVDASEHAYGSVAYLQCTYANGKKSKSFVTSKSRVAPLKAISIPRLELMAAVLGAKLAESITKALDIEMSRVVFWSDSMNVIHWVRSISRSFKQFVANRISFIQEISDPKQWHYVPTKENPADLLTRGLKVSTLANCDLWWQGPHFLDEPEDKWPVASQDKVKSVDNEVKNRKVGRSEKTLATVNRDSDWRLAPTRFSSWLKLTRIDAWVHRFLDNCQLPPGARLKGELTPEEIEDAENRIIKQAQVESFDTSYKVVAKGNSLPQSDKLTQLQPFLDDDGVMRCNGRLKFVEFLSYNSRFPIILPRKHWVTKLIVRHFHEEEKHICGTNHCLATLSSRFWIVAAREEIRECERECVVCQKKKSSPASQILAPLHRSRTQMTYRAFDHVAVDFGGPFITVQGRGKRREKRYLCLFTCLATRAVHLELAFSLDTDSFLNAFYRMVSRRGLPREITSDNGTNFVGAQNELQELQKIDNRAVENSTSSKGVKWHFNPPAAPHFGGAHEIMIKAAKRAIYAILGNAEVSDEELLTAIVAAEGLINSRPLTYQSSNPQDLVPLTPNHFLHGQVGGQFAPDSVDQTEFNPRKRWRRIQELVRHFWHRWLREWLPGLNSRQKWNKKHRDIQEGDIVLVVATDTPRGQWPLGRILETTHGRDGHVRVVKVKVGKNVYSRSVTRICPLEFGKQD